MSNSVVTSLLDEILAETRREPRDSKRNPATAEPASFVPREPASLQEAGLSQADVEALMLKFLLNCNTATGWQIAEQICLPTTLVLDVLRNMKLDQLIVYRRAAGPNDYEHELTAAGHERARRYYSQRTYYGSAPVPLADYQACVAKQSLRNERPKAADLKQALTGLKIGPEIFSQLGQAISSVGAIFLYGQPGNGKTSIAERLTNAFGSCIWIPRAISIDGDIVRIFDPMVHEEVPVTEALSPNERGIDRRWIRIRRPTVVAGGELTLDHLEFGVDRNTGSVEAPLHLKSNCGTLVIDDFGRQRVGTTELLNRWIVPLEKRYDYLMTPAGKKIQVPFDQLIVFATNLEPENLVDEAFLRRIPYKVEVKNPTETEFRELFQSLSEEFEIEHRMEVVDYLITEHYRNAGRPLRFCHVRDLLRQMGNHCRFHDRKFEMTHEGIDAVVLNYFGTMAPVPVAISRRERS